MTAVGATGGKMCITVLPFVSGDVLQDPTECTVENYRLNRPMVKFSTLGTCCEKLIIVT